MAINKNTNPALSHHATLSTTGNWVAPANVNAVFVSIHGSSGGSGGASQYGNRYVPTQKESGAGGVGVVASGWVQVTAGAAHPITIGAAGTGGTVPATNSANAGNAAGTSLFDTAITAVGGGGGAAMVPNSNPVSQPPGNAGTGSGTTSLTVVPVSNIAIPRVTGFTTQTTGGVAGGAAQTPARYSQSSIGQAGATGSVHIYY